MARHVLPCACVYVLVYRYVYAWFILVECARTRCLHYIEVYDNFLSRILLHDVSTAEEDSAMCVVFEEAAIGWFADDGPAVDIAEEGRR